MGPDFSMDEWLRCWLLETSGINTIEPLVEYDHFTGQLSSLKIRQGLGMRGKNRLKIQKLDIGLYNRSNPSEKPVIIKNIILRDYDQDTPIDLSLVSLPAGFVLGAVYLNEGGYAVAKLRFDSDSLNWFTSNLEKVADPLTRASIWRQLWL